MPYRVLRDQPLVEEGIFPVGSFIGFLHYVRDQELSMLPASLYNIRQGRTIANQGGILQVILESRVPDRLGDIRDEKLERGP